jgi:Co/Zn/Cd efflux system component
MLKNLTLQSRLFIATVLMLIFAAVEIILGRFIGLSAISADGVNMLGHSLLLFIALVVDSLRRVFEKEGRMLEAIGGLIGGLFLVGMALMMALGAGHHHHSLAEHAQFMAQMGSADFCGLSPGTWMSALAGASFVLHAGLSLYLLKDIKNLNVAGACLHFGFTTLTTAAMFISGVLMVSFGWWFLSDVLMLIITALMTVSGARLGFKSLGLLNKSLKKA